ncbi:hypothetical protein ES708_32609 [subsurface metagenome]
MKRLIIGLLVVMLLSLLGCDSTAISPPETPASITITGSDNEKSSTFTTTTAEWTINWSYIPERWAKYYFFALTVFPDNESSAYIETMVSKGKTSGTVSVSAEPGDYYIKVYTASVESWALEVLIPQR